MPNLLNVVLKNSSVIALLPPTYIVIPLRESSAVGSGELGAATVVSVVEPAVVAELVTAAVAELAAAAAEPVAAAGGVVFEVEETKLLYKFCKHIQSFIIQTKKKN